MDNTTTTTGDPFKGAPIIHSYTRADAIADGFLVPVQVELSKEAGLAYPVAITRAAWERCVELPSDPVAACGQDTTGRLWDVLWMARCAVTLTVAMRSERDERSMVQVPVLVRNRGTRPTTERLVMHCGPGDCPRPVLTIGYPEDF